MTINRTSRKSSTCAQLTGSLEPDVKMQLVSLLFLVAIGFQRASASVIEASVEARGPGCKHGESWPALRPDASPGCAWYYCSGGRPTLWADCGAGSACADVALGCVITV